MADFEPFFRQNQEFDQTPIGRGSSWVSRRMLYEARHLPTITRDAFIALVPSSVIFGLIMAFGGRFE
jgi:hypothetical protein